MVIGSQYIPLLLITGLAVVVPILTDRFKRIQLPIVVGEILAGILIGKSGCNLVQPTAAIEFLSQFGFTFLMFLSGLEVNLETLFAAAEPGGSRFRWRSPISISLIYFSMTLFIAGMFGIGLAYMELASNAILMGLILCTTSLGVVVPILKEKGLTSTTYGQTLLITAFFSDFITLVLLSLMITLMSQGHLVNILFFLILLVTFVVTMKVSVRIKKMPMLGRIVENLSHATAQIQVRGAFALMVIWVVLAEILGIEVILGAFLAGLILSVNSPKHETPLREKLDAVGYGFFIPIFFINVGVGFDLRSLMVSHAAMPLVVILIAVAYLVKLLPALLFNYLFTLRQSIAAGFLLSSRMSLIIAASAIALKLGVINAATNTAVILTAVVTCTISPLIFSKILFRPAQSTELPLTQTDTP